jgi:hypothetical protein
MSQSVQRQATGCLAFDSRKGQEFSPPRNAQPAVQFVLGVKLPGNETHKSLLSSDKNVGVLSPFPDILS